MESASICITTGSHICSARRRPARPGAIARACRPCESLSRDQRCEQARSGLGALDGENRSAFYSAIAGTLPGKNWRECESVYDAGLATTHSRRKQMEKVRPLGSHIDTRTRTLEHMRACARTGG